MSTPALPSLPQRITLAGGCFWCLDAAYRPLRGVLRVECGYSNGHVLRPSYRDVCTGRTGHAEVIRLDFDPDVLPLNAVLEVFFAMHDPTTRNRQGNDVGPQYRSGIYTHDAAQLTAVRSFVQRLSEQKLFADPIVTEIEPESNYSPAEEEHQDYFAHHPYQGYCAAVIAPKVDKLRKRYAALLRTDV
ncbi:MAG: peptide-methionine (S)-S-oxide reductase MsrA [Thiomonas sp.]